MASNQGKLKGDRPLIVSANRLGDGVVIYFTTARSWSRDIADAAVTVTKAEAETLLAEAALQGIQAVGAYLVPVALNGADPEPLDLRERIRLNGPTVAIPGAV